MIELRVSGRCLSASLSPKYTTVVTFLWDLQNVWVQKCLIATPPQKVDYQFMVLHPH